MKNQATLETAILFAFSLLLIVGFISYAVIVNNHNLQYETTPFVLSSLKFYNFQTIGSTCSFDFEFQTNAYLPYPKYELTFILNNGQRIVPNYRAYTETVTPVLSNGYQYTFVLNGAPNYNGSVCSVMGQQSVNHAYVKYVSYKNANGKTIVQPVSTNYVFQINSASTMPNQLYNNNTIFITGSVIPYSGYVYISYQNGTSVSGSPFTLGEYVYLPAGNYTLSYTNETYPVSFQYWSSSGGVIIQNAFSSATNMIVINNGEIYLNLRNLLKPSETFIIYANKTYSTIPGKFNITANFSKNGSYTYYVNNQPYKDCVDVSQTSCIMTFNTAGEYTISAIFKNSTTFAEATPIKFYVFDQLSATLSSNETGAQNKTNVLLSVTTYNGLKPFAYYFYVNNMPIHNCTDISTPTCIYNIDNPPNKYIYNYVFTANVSDAGGELITTNNVIVEGIVAIPIILYNSQNQTTPTPFQQMIQINETQFPFKNVIIYNKTFANFEFIYQNDTVIPAWIESNQSGKLTIWVKLVKSIPADSSATIYLKYAGSKNLLNSSGTTGIGEAPQLSSTYGQYDDGASVFNYYQRWGGLSTLPSGWSSIANTSITYASNYTKISASSNNSMYGIYLNPLPSSLSSTPTIWEFYGNMYSNVPQLPTVYNPTSYNGTANIIFNQSTSLSGDIIAYSVTIDSGVTLTSNGHSIICNSYFINNGEISTGRGASGGARGAPNGSPGASVTTSYGGSGGGGGGGNGYGWGASGGSTAVSGGGGGGGSLCGGSGYNGGNGNTPPSAPTLSNSTIQTWYNNGIQNYLEGAGGGGGGAGCTMWGTGGSGGSGGAGIYIQAMNISTGTINSSGANGVQPYWAGGGGGGGGGGGSILLAYETNYIAGTYNTNGGSGAPGNGYGGDGFGGGGHGGNGGNGLVLTYQFTTSPIKTPNDAGSIVGTSNSNSSSFSYTFSEGNSNANTIYLGNAGNQFYIPTSYNDINGNKVYTMQMNSTTSLQMFINYTQIYSTTYAVAESPTYFDIITGNSDGNPGASATPIYIYWLRTRAYPPNGVMPSVTIIS